MKPKILILHASGTNRDEEAARACELAGGAAQIVHMNRLRAGQAKLTDFDALLFPGGFTYGDALGAGARLALDLQVYLADQLQTFVETGRPILGICNGFQTLVKCGLLPGQPPANGAAAPRRVTLTENREGHFECRWVYLAANPQARLGWPAKLDDLILCPIAHGEGNFQVSDPAMLDELEQDRLIAFRYVNSAGGPAGEVYPLNPNGSVRDIAGICNRQGNVLGLMPHPEDHLLPIQHPLGRNGQLGLPLFTAFVRAAA